LEDDWLIPPEHAVKERQLQRQDNVRCTYELPVEHPPDTMPILSLDGTPVSPLRTSMGGSSSHPPSKGVSAVPAASTSKVNVSKKGVPPYVVPIDDPPILATPPTSTGTDLLGASTVRRSNRSTKGTFQTPHFRDQVFLTSIDRFSDPSGHEAQFAYLADVFTCMDTGIMDVSDPPRAYAAKQRGGNADNPTFQQAMNGPAAEEYIQAMKLEIETRIAQRTWDPVPRKPDMNVLKGTWALKLKRLPDGTAFVTRLGFVSAVTFRRRESISLKPMHQLCSLGPLFVFCSQQY
jgi:hypothetical protein